MKYPTWFLRPTPSTARGPFRLLFKAAWSLLILFALLAAGGYVLVRSVLSPERIRPLVESRLSTALGKPVRLGAMGIHLFPVPSLVAQKVQVGETSQEAPSLAIASLRVSPSLSAALRGQLVVDRVDLEGLDIALRRTRKGIWLLPYDPPKDPASSGTQESAGTAVEVRTVRLRNGRFRLVDEAPHGGGPAREVARLSDLQGTFSLGADGLRVQELTTRLLKTELAGSAVISADKTILKLSSPSIASADLPQIFALLGAAPIEGLSVAGTAPFRIEMTLPQQGSLSASGEFDAATLRLGTLEVTALKTPFQVEQDTATLSPLTFTAYGGKQKGSVTLAFSRDPMAYSVKTSLEGLDVNQALSANTSARDTLLGRGQLSGTFKGAGFDAGALKSRLSGDAQVALREGVIRNLPLLARINQALKLTAGDTKDTRFESLDGAFLLGSGKAHTENLTLKAGELTLAAKGDIRFDLTLAFKGTARFTPAKTAQFLHSLKDLKRLVNEQGELEIPLTVTGPVAAPSVNVDLSAAASRAVKQELKQQLGDQLKKLFKK